MEGFAPKIKQQEKVAETKAFNKIPFLNKEQQNLMEDGYKKVKTIASEMFHKIKNKNVNTNFELDDFIGWGTEGLAEAVEKFDSSLGFKFDVFSSKFIEGRIIDNLRSQNMISRDHLEFLQKRKKSIESLHKELKREPIEIEIAKKMGLTLEEYFKKIKLYPIGAGTVYLADFPNDNGNTETDSFLDALIQKENPYRPDCNDKKDNKIDFLNKFLNQLNLEKKERQIIDTYFTKELTLEEIGNKLNVTESRVCQVKNRVLKRLRKLFEEQGYKIPNVNRKFIKNKSEKQESRELSRI